MQAISGGPPRNARELFHLRPTVPFSFVLTVLHVFHVTELNALTCIP
jgi:hypothetical protein